MAKLKGVKLDRGKEIVAYGYFCVGCEMRHIIFVKHVDKRHVWGFNGDLNKPTFTPSILTKYTHPKGHSNANPAPVDYDGEYVTEICHSFVTDGVIKFLSDCTHSLAGQTVDMVEEPHHA